MPNPQRAVSVSYAPQHVPQIEEPLSHHVDHAALFLNAAMTPDHARGQNEAALFLEEG
jgi:hypothetical protein